MSERRDLDDGHGGWEMPYRRIEGGNQAIVSGLMVDGLDVLSARHESPAGSYGVVHFMFKSSAVPESPPTPLTFIGTPESLRSLAKMLYRVASEAAWAAESKRPGREMPDIGYPEEGE